MADDIRRSRARATRPPLVVALIVVAACASGAPTSIDCDETSGSTEDVDVDRFTALVHLPPCYDTGDGDYPTVYLLHGAGMSPQSWTDPAIGADRIADRMMVGGNLEPVIMVFAQRSTTNRRFADDVIDSLIEVVDEAYRVSDEPTSRGIGGFSAGGPATAYAAFTGPARFGAVGLFAVTWSAVDGADLVEAMADRSDRPGVRIDVGERDRLGGNVERIEQDLAAIDIVPEVTVVPGGHDFAFVADRIDDWLQWFEQQRT